jgi:hypothetical protein
MRNFQTKTTPTKKAEGDAPSTKMEQKSPEMDGSGSTGTRMIRVPSSVAEEAWEIKKQEKQVKP